MTPFDEWFESYVKRCARSMATAAYLAALKRGHSEAYAKKLARELYTEHLKRNLE